MGLKGIYCPTEECRMTTELILSIINTVLLTGGGLYLKSYTDTQLKTKEEIIKLKDEQIEKLKAESFPALAKEYETARKHAEAITAEKQKLIAEKEALELSRSRFAVSTVPGKEYLAECNGLLMYDDAMQRYVESLIVDRNIDKPISVMALQNAVISLREEMIPLMKEKVTLAEGSLKKRD
jgi:hypothetical protein